MGTLMPPTPSAPRTLVVGLPREQQPVADVTAGRLERESQNTGA